MNAYMPDAWSAAFAAIAGSAAAVFIVSILLLMSGQGATSAVGGLYWVVPGLVAAMVAAIIGAWVMLVEILR